MPPSEVDSIGFPQFDDNSTMEQGAGGSSSRDNVCEDRKPAAVDNHRSYPPGVAATTPAQARDSSDSESCSEGERDSSNGQGFSLPVGETHSLAELDEAAVPLLRAVMPDNVKKQDMGKIYSRRKRVRQKMKVTGLEEQCQRLRADNERLVDQNVYFESLLHACKSQISRDGRGRSSNSVAIFPQPRWDSQTRSWRPSDADELAALLQGGHPPNVFAAQQLPLQRQIFNYYVPFDPFQFVAAQEASGLSSLSELEHIWLTASQALRQASLHDALAQQQLLLQEAQASDWLRTALQHRLRLRSSQHAQSCFSLAPDRATFDEIVRTLPPSNLAALVEQLQTTSPAQAQALLDAWIRLYRPN